MQQPVLGKNFRPDLPLAVIVGAGGMGMAIARRLGQAHRLLIADRDAAHLDQQSAILTRDGHDVSTIMCDVTASYDIRNLVSRSKEIGPFKALANVAGLSPSMGDFDSIIGVNIMGASRVAEAFGPMATPGACAIFVSSMAAHMQPTALEVQALLEEPLQADLLPRLKQVLGEEATSHIAYLISKAALNRMCRRRSRAWGEKGARILSVSPGLFATPMGALEFEQQPIKYDLLAATPMKREGTLLEIANVVEFLMSDKASFISGTDILVDGGLVGTLQDGDGLLTTPYEPRSDQGFK